MEIRSYLPSAQFTVLILAVALSGGLVWGAERLTRPPSYAVGIKADVLATEDSVWRGQLLALASSTAPEVPGDVASLLEAAHTENLTESVGRTLLLNLSAAQAENMTNDENAQDDIVSAALREVTASPRAAYATADLTLTADSETSLRAYGNGVITAVGQHPAASWGVVAQAAALAVDTNDPSHEKTLLAAAADYRALAKSLAELSVPQSLASLHLRMVNDFAAEGDACADIAAVLSDPLRGLRGFETYQALVNDVVTVFTTLRSVFSQNGILFTKDEPGYSWTLLQSSQ